MSFGSPQANTRWVRDQGYQFEIWTDDDKTLALYYGAAASTATAFPQRITKLLGADGSVILEYDDVSVGTHPLDVLDDCTKLFAK